MKIGAHNFTVNFVNHWDIDSDYGNTSSMTNEINIVKTLPDSHKVATFFHEVFHDLNLKLDDVTIEFLSQGMAQVLLDNDLFNMKKFKEKTNDRTK